MSKTNQDNQQPELQLSPRDLEAQEERDRLGAIRSDSNKVNRSKEHANSLRRSIINKEQRDASYKRTMDRVQGELSKPSLTFSKILHISGIEKTIEIVGSTVARPKPMLFGAILAFTVMLIAYLISRVYGYTLSGSEAIMAFIVGWVIGLVYDGLISIFKRKKSL